MIAALVGVVREKGLADVVVMVGGVGYLVHCSQLTLVRLPDPGKEVALRVRTVVRDDALDLFGFLTRAEEDLFSMLTQVSHVGPKMALNVLSGLETDELLAALSAGDVARLTRIHGVGKRTAERLVLELKEKARARPRSGSDGRAPLSDVTSALGNLGYKPAQAEEASLRAVAALGSEAPFELLFRHALQSLKAG